MLTGVGGVSLPLPHPAAATAIAAMMTTFFIGGSPRGVEEASARWLPEPGTDQGHLAAIALQGEGAREDPGVEHGDESSGLAGPERAGDDRVLEVVAEHAPGWRDKYRQEGRVSRAHVLVADVADPEDHHDLSCGGAEVAG